VSKKRIVHLQFIIQRVVISLLVVFVLVGLIYPRLSTRTIIPCANTISCLDNLKLSVDNDVVGIFNNRRVIPPEISLIEDGKKIAVLGTDTNAGEKHIYVDLATQTLSAYQGNKLFMQTLISTGKWFPTPTGDFTIWVKLRATRMSGGVGDDYYDLPNVPYVMFFSNNEVAKSTGFSLHGAYWHNNFGHPMSHGCVNMRETDAEKIYNWVNPVTTGPTTYTDNKNLGTKITIYGKAPI
jgi:hypothetical protein